MPALVITAVDNTTEILTSVAHGLNTGDGPAAVFVGAGGVIPTGLAPVTDYWIIKTDADHFKLASSSANAFAGTAINITTNGTLPLSLLVGIPYRRARTYLALQQIKSADLDALQDAHTALWNLFSGQAQAIYSGVTLAVPLAAPTVTTALSNKWRWSSPSTPNILSVAGTNTMNADNLSFGAGGKFSGMMLGPWNEGDKITGFGVRHIGTGAAWTASYILQMNVGGTITPLGTISIVTPPAAWATYTLVGLSQVLPVHASLYLDQTAGAQAGNQLGLVGVQYERPSGLL